VKAIYPADSDGDPEAVPGIRPQTASEAPVPSFTLEVDGEVFAVRPGKLGGTEYTWLSGPNTGYGFSESPTPGRSLDEHRESIRNFLAQIDPTTGYIEED
jgi:hypothetical protein